MNNVNSAMNLWFGLVILVVFSIGLAADILFFALYWDKLIKLFKTKLENVPWWLIDVFKICWGLFLIFITFSLTGNFILKLNPGLKKDIKPVLNIINGVCIYCFGIWYIIHFLKTRYESVLDYLGIKWSSWLKKSVKVLFLYAGFIPILIGLTYISAVFCALFGITPESHPLVNILKKEKSFLFIGYLIVVATIIAPIFEEILFRGLFYQALKKRVGIFRAVVISSMLFSFLHFNTAQFLPIMGLGALLCLIFEYTGSLVPAIFIHIFNNGMFLGLFFILKEYL